MSKIKKKDLEKDNVGLPANARMFTIGELAEDAKTEMLAEHKHQTYDRVTQQFEDSECIRITFKRPPCRILSVAWRLTGVYDTDAFRSIVTRLAPDVFFTQELPPKIASSILECLPRHKKIEDKVKGWDTDCQIFFSDWLLLEKSGTEMMPSGAKIFYVQLRDVTSAKGRFVAANIFCPSKREDFNKNDAVLKKISDDLPMIIYLTVDDDPKAFNSIKQMGLRDCFSSLGMPLRPTFPQRPVSEPVPDQVLDFLVHRHGTTGQVRPLIATVLENLQAAEGQPIALHMPINCCYELIGPQKKEEEKKPMIKQVIPEFEQPAVIRPIKQLQPTGPKVMEDRNKADPLAGAEYDNQKRLNINKSFNRTVSDDSDDGPSLKYPFGSFYDNVNVDSAMQFVSSLFKEKPKDWDSVQEKFDTIMSTRNKETETGSFAPQSRSCGSIDPLPTDVRHIHNSGPNGWNDPQKSFGKSQTFDMGSSSRGAHNLLVKGPVLGNFGSKKNNKGDLKVQDPASASILSDNSSHTLNSIGYIGTGLSTQSKQTKSSIPNNPITINSTNQGIIQPNPTNLGSKPTNIQPSDISGGLGISEGSHLGVHDLKKKDSGLG